MRHPAAPLALALLTGTAGGLFAHVPTEALAAVVWIGWVLSLVAFTQRDARAFAVTCLLVTAACGWALAVAATWDATHPSIRTVLRQARGPAGVADGVGEPVILSGRLREDVSAVVEGARVSLAVIDATIDGRLYQCGGGVLLTVAGNTSAEQAGAWRRGRLIRAPALLRRPARYLNRGVPDHELALLRRGVAMVGTIKSALLINVEQEGTWLDERASAWRAAARRVIDAKIGRHSQRSAAIVCAILIGDRTALDDETVERLQAAGTYHVLAISGGNVAILAGIVLLILRGVTVQAPASDVVAGVALVAYAWIVGGGASVTRATLMAVTMLAGHALDHRSHPYNALSVAAVCGLATSPLGLFDPGAWLTYGATFAIVTAAVYRPPCLAARAVWVRAAAGVLLASIAAEIALFPIGAFVFARVTAAGLLLNFAAIPLMTIVQVGAIATLAAAPVATTAASVLGHATHLAAWGLVESARFVDVVPWIARRLPSPSAWALAVYYAGWFAVLGSAMAGTFGPLERRARAVGAAFVLASGMWILVAPVPWWTFPRDELRILFIDVGQGDATLVRCPDGSAVLVDAGGAGGGRFDVGRRVVEPAVWAMGVRRLTALIVTHADADHMNGAAAVMRDITPREVWEGIPVPSYPPLAELRLAAAARGVAWRIVQRGDRLDLGEVQFVVRHPALAEWERQRVRNDDSVVVELRYRDVSVILPGDVEEAGEREMLPLLDRVPIRILHAPHHGSASSSSEAFVGAAMPVLGIVSAGRGNRFGHPHRIVLHRFAALGTPVLRTDRDGAILLATDGRGVRVETFTGRTIRLSPDPTPAVR